MGPDPILSIFNTVAPDPKIHLLNGQCHECSSLRGYANFELYNGITLRKRNFFSLFIPRAQIDIFKQKI